MPPETPPNRGVYFLANDDVLELALAFLNSFRLRNPALPLRLIPFDAHCRQLLELRSRYGFDVHADLALLEECDRISVQFHDRVRGHYRKLAAWSGGFGEFIVIDTDTVVLAAVDFVFPLLRENEFIVATAGIAENRRWVWQDSIVDQGELTADEIAYAASTGFIASRAGLLSMDYVRSKLPGALRCRPHMELSCYEQPFLNYLMVTSERRCSSLLEWARRYPGWLLPLEAWAGASRVARIRESQGAFFLEDRRTGRRLSPVLFVHWASLWAPSPWEGFLFRWLARLGLQRRRHQVRIFLPWRALWLRFRHLDTHR